MGALGRKKNIYIYKGKKVVVVVCKQHRGGDPSVGGIGSFFLLWIILIGAPFALGLDRGSGLLSVQRTAQRKKFKG